MKEMREWYGVYPFLPAIETDTGDASSGPGDQPPPQRRGNKGSSHPESTHRAVGQAAPRGRTRKQCSYGVRPWLRYRRISTRRLKCKYQAPTCSWAHERHVPDSEITGSLWGKSKNDTTVLGWSLTAIAMQAIILKWYKLFPENIHII